MQNRLGSLYSLIDSLAALGFENWNAGDEPHLRRAALKTLNLLRTVMDAL